MQKEPPFVSIITVNFNGRQLLKPCFDSLLALAYPPDRREIIMVDNCSTDGSAEYAENNFPSVRVIRNNVNNYCRANNLAISSCRGELVALVNNDVTVDTHWLEEMVRVMRSRRKASAVGSKVLFPDGRIQSAGHAAFPHFCFGDRGLYEEDNGQYDRVEEVVSVSNCAAVYRKKALVDAGLFDEDFGMYLEDVDINFRLRQKGGRVFYAPQSIAYHCLHGSGQSEAERAFYIEKNRLFFIAKHFPDKLSGALAGFGGIMKIKDDDYRGILRAAQKKLGLQRSVKAGRIMADFQRSRAELEEFRRHCESVERNKEITALNQKLQALEQQLSAQEEQLRQACRQLDIQAGELAIHKEQETYCQEELKKTDAQRQSLADKLAEKEQEAERLQGETAVLQEKADSLEKVLYDQAVMVKLQAERIHMQGKEIEEKNNRLESDGAQLRSLNEQVMKLTTLQVAKETQLTLLQSDLETIRQQAVELQAQHAAAQARINELNTQTAEKDALIKNLNINVRERQEEIVKIYDSETYRLIVRPIIWPLFTMLKKIRALFRRLRLGERTPEDRGGSVAFVSARSTAAHLGQDNRYFIKLVNVGMTEGNVKLAVDIWPSQNQYHPERHYAYFAAHVSVAPQAATEVTLVYDWDKKIVFSSAGKELKTCDAWRGPMTSRELYGLNVSLYNAEGNQISTATILQRLEQ